MGGVGGDVGKCVGVWGPNTLLIPHISLPSPFPTSPLTSPTPHHTFLHLLSYLFAHPSFLPPHLNTFSYYPHISLHLLKVWQSYYVTKFLWRSYWQLSGVPLDCTSLCNPDTHCVRVRVVYVCIAHDYLGNSRQL